MLISLSVRNVLRNLRRIAPMVFTIVVIFILLSIGNAVLDTTKRSLYNVYAENISGDFTISSVPQGEKNFTLFGSDQLLVGQYLIPPVLTESAELRDTLENLPEVEAVSGLISSAARVEIGKTSRYATVLGVDFDTYPDAVPGLQLEAGTFPESGEPGILIQDQGWGASAGRIGQKALLASALGLSFVLREAPVTGVFSYPVSDSMLDNVILADADTARALNGYLYGSDAQNIIPEKDRKTLETDVDDLFSGFSESSGSFESGDGGQNSAAEQQEAPLIDPDLLFSDEDADTDADASANADADVPADADEQAAAGTAVDSGKAWNFLLVSLHDRGDFRKVRRKLVSAGFGENQGYLIRSWNASVGGNAQLAWFLQLMFNIGLLFVSFAAVIIAANALLLSILERTQEIGTLRALGAGRPRIAAMVFLETFFIVFSSAAAGIILGWFGLNWLNASQIIIENPYLNLLFGGKPLQGTMTANLVSKLLAAALGLTVVSMLYPLKRALQIQPEEAMAE